MGEQKVFKISFFTENFVKSKLTTFSVNRFFSFLEIRPFQALVTRIPCVLLAWHCRLAFRTRKAELELIFCKRRAWRKQNCSVHCTLFSFSDRWSLPQKRTVDTFLRQIAFAKVQLKFSISSPKILSEQFPVNATFEVLAY